MITDFFGTQLKYTNWTECGFNKMAPCNTSEYGDKGEISLRNIFSSERCQLATEIAPFDTVGLCATTRNTVCGDKPFNS